MRCLFFTLIVCVMISSARAENIVPPVYGGNPYANPDNIPNVVSPYVHFKSPNPDMHFTLGQPVRVLADGLDPNSYTVNEVGTPIVELFVDGVSQGTTSQVSPDQRGWNEFIVNNLTPGTHTLDLKGTYIGGGSNHGPTIQIIIDAPPPHANTVTLTQDLVLSGSQSLNWSDATVAGNGHVVSSANGWTGSLTIQNCHVSGLGGLAAAGIDVTTQNGSVTVQDSIFEWTGAINVTMSGSGSLQIKRNQFRANCQIELRPVWDPTKAPIFHAVGNPSGTKVFQGNNVGYGFAMFENMNNLLIGGDTDAEGNVLIGPRCGFSLYRCQNATLRGNYSTHNYRGEWSQGFNFLFQECAGLLVEHNVIRGGSWPVQNMAGEFRYNLVIDSGHDWVRSIDDNSLLHHNVFIQASGDGNVNEGMWMYASGHNVSVFNNTFDCGGTLINWNAPAINISDGSSMASIRNNAITNIFPSYNPDTAITFVQAVNGAIGYADYNAFWNPDTAHGTRYSAGAVTGHTVGQAGFGMHDVQSDVKFAQGLILPYPIKEGDVWNRVTGISHVLSDYRTRYTPAAGSPLIDSGDPADGAGTDIGAVGAGVAHAGDLFGTFGQVNGNFPPACRLIAPDDGAFFATGSTITLTAEALDYDGSVSKVEFLNGSTILGSVTATPFTVSWPSVAEGIYTITVRATDNKNAVATGTPVHISVGNRAPIIQSAAAATPNPATVNQAISFSVVTSDPDGNALNYAWSFGDGTTASVENPAHAYSAAGTFQASVTIQDGHGGSVASNVAVSVSPNSTGGGGESTGAGGGGFSTPSPIAFTLNKLIAKMDFAKANRDAIAFAGILPNLAAGFSSAGKHVKLIAGAATLDVDIGANGRGKATNGSFTLQLKQTRPTRGSGKKTFPGGNAPFKASIRNGTWAQSWLGTADPASISGQTISLPIQVIFDGVTYEIESAPAFRYSKSKKGKLAFAL